MESLQGNLFDGKSCRRCGQWKLTTEFDVAKTCKGGRRPTCRECQRPRAQRKEYMDQWKAENKDHRNAYRRQWRRDNPDKAKAADQRIYQRHREKAIKRGREYQLRNHEEYKRRLREYHQANREVLLEKHRIWVEKKKAELGEEWYEQNRKRSREWARANREKTRVTHANANARRKRQSEGTWTAEEFLAICNHYGNVCLCCKEPKKLHADHVIPLIKKGRNDITNLQPLCHNCNSRKHDNYADYRPDGGEFARSLKR